MSQCEAAESSSQVKVLSHALNEEFVSHTR